MPSHPGFARIASIAALAALAASTSVRADTSVHAWAWDRAFPSYIDDGSYRLVVRKFTIFEVSPPPPGGLVLRFEGSPPFWQWLAADVLTMTTAGTPLRTRWNGQSTSAIGGGSPANGAAVQLTAATRSTLMTAAFHTPLAGSVDVYGRIGMLRTETRLLAHEAAPIDTSHDFRDSHSAPWLGVGLRYRSGDGPTLSAEYGAGDGLRNARIAIGWRF